MAKLLPVVNNAQFINGEPAVGAKLFFYAAGSSTKQTTYADEAGLIPQTNPIILDSRGEPSQPVWGTEGLSYKIVFTASTDSDPPASPIWDIDDVTGINDASVAVDQWVDSGVTPTYVSATSFTLPGDQTSAFTVGRRIKTLVTAGTAYGRISASVFGALTAVTVVMDSTPLDSGLSSVQLGLLTPDNTSIPVMQDNYLLISGSADKTKLLGFEVDGLTTATKRTWTAQDKDITVAGLDDVQNTVFSTSKIQPITAVANTPANSLTITLSPTRLDFRDALNSGTVNTVSNAASISTIISSGSTGGTVSAVRSRLAILAINNAGTIELAWCNASGGVVLDDSKLISTTAEGGAGGADSATVIYSTTARASVAFRIVGFIESTQATAGTWITSPSLIQGAGTPATNLIPLGMAAFYESPQQTITSSGALTLAHGLGRKPVLTKLVLQCTTAEFGFAIGDEVTEIMQGFNGVARGVQIVPDATNINVKYGTDANVFWVIRKDTGATTQLTNANWRFVVRAWG
jgi:hypothetical protein